MNTAITLDLDGCADELVLCRVLSVCARRRCQIRRLSFSEDSGRVELTVRGPEGQVGRLAEWLARLVHVQVLNRR